MKLVPLPLNKPTLPLVTVRSIISKFILLSLIAIFKYKLSLLVVSPLAIASLLKSYTLIVITGGVLSNVQINGSTGRLLFPPLSIKLASTTPIEYCPSFETVKFAL